MKDLINAAKNLGLNYVFECFIPDEEYVKLKDNKKALKEYIEENGYLDIDDWIIDEAGPIDNIEIYNI